MHMILSESAALEAQLTVLLPQFVCRTRNWSTFSTSKLSTCSSGTHYYPGSALAEQEARLLDQELQHDQPVKNLDY